MTGKINSKYKMLQLLEDICAKRPKMKEAYYSMTDKQREAMEKSWEKIISAAENTTGILKDQADGKGELKYEIVPGPGGLCLKFEGYGDHCSEDGYGAPVMIELYEGDVRVIIWADINQEDFTQLIPLKNAKESLRKEE